VASHKYGAKRTEVDGIVFASRAESVRYRELQLLARVGQISGLELQVPFELVVGGVKILGANNRVLRYVADFVYVDSRTGQRVIEDVKGVDTPVYALKRAIMRAMGLPVTEVRTRGRKAPRSLRGRSERAILS
jgi:hypothetical protein